MNSYDEIDCVIVSTTMKLERMTGGTPNLDFIGRRCDETSPEHKNYEKMSLRKVNFYK